MKYRLALASKIILAVVLIATTTVALGISHISAFPGEPGGFYKRHSFSQPPCGTPAVSISSWGPDRLDIFALSSCMAGATLRHVWYDGSNGGWHDWEELGRPSDTNLVASPNTPPSAVSWGPGRIDTVALGFDNQIWHKAYDADEGGWQGWDSRGGYLTSAPTISSWGPNRLDIFALGGNKALYHMSWDGEWNDWESLGGYLTSAPTAVSMDVDRVDVFGRADDDMWHKWFDAKTGGWHEWQYFQCQPPNSYPFSTPAVSSIGRDLLVVFVRNTDTTMSSNIDHRDIEDARGCWWSLGNSQIFNSDPSATTLNSYTIDLIALAPGNLVSLMESTNFGPEG